MAAGQHTEQWRSTTVRPDYVVSDLGRIRSPRGNILKPYTLKSGHQQVSLGKVRGQYVHRLVLEAFIGPCPPGMQACHWDDDPSNNALSNLRWGTPSDNGHDRTRNGRNPMAERTHCPKGHEYTEANTYVYTQKNGNKARFCRTCDVKRPRRGRSSYDENGVWRRR